MPPCVTCMRSMKVTVTFVVVRAVPFWPSASAYAFHHTAVPDAAISMIRCRGDGQVRECGRCREAVRIAHVQYVGGRTRVVGLAVPVAGGLNV